MDWIFYGTAENDLIDMLGEPEFIRFKFDLELYPQRGDVIRDTGGFRKVRYPIRKRNIGARKGARVIYLFLVTKTAFHVFDAYTHEEKDDISAGDKKVMREIAKELKRQNEQQQK
ncbi:MAG: hypothetical protein A3G34_08620 [Candidatus Lindowbacteria bacterium RIFCSPLOWO2_12_FULL_62_27]|nr:MAG: hypothetical protein A3G34_08620 [Candidatus Lindowbacteria bacterium RIFCSPLOWO2_12_FULL_62_27]OGH62957.1 MAG: hypothetical protein A3I06_13870 [Candidatus Lindowbacteria bacterium RIFCSPLOWO2_02_FULL_62_12]